MLLLCHLEGPKNQSFRNNTGIPQLIRAKFGTHRSRGDNAQEILGAIVSLGENERGGSDEPPAETVVLSSKRDDFSATIQLPIFTEWCRFE